MQKHPASLIELLNPGGLRNSTEALIP